jgi:outer membrane receptor for ferrienterochelin and colicins
MKWIDIICIISIIFAFVAFAEAKTTTIYGTILQEKDNLSLPAAQITLKNLDTDELKAYTSDLRGKYNISDIKPGKYAITVEVGGFEAVTKEVEIQANQQIELNFKLKIASVRETLVVTATRTERPLKDATVRTQLIRRNDIENRMAFFLSDALNYSSGIRVENNCQNCGFFQIRMNGLEGKYTQILMDGMDAFSSLAQVYGAEHIPSEMIERIEVVKGGGSSLYGGQAVGGTINIISRKPSYTGVVIDTMLGWQKGEPTYDFGGYGSWLSSEGTLGLQFFGKHLKQNPTDRNDDGFTDTTKRNLSSAGIKLFKQFVNLNAQMTADVHYTHEFRRGGNKLDLAPHLTDITEQIETDRIGGNIAWWHFLSPKASYKLSVSYTDTERDTYYGAGMDPNAYGWSKGPLFVFDSQFNRIIGGHTLTVGMQFKQDKLEDVHPAYERHFDESYDDVGFFLQDEIEIGDEFTLLLGGRADKHSAVENLIFSPRASILIHALEDQLHLRATVARGFRAPSVFIEDLHILIAGGEAIIRTNAPDLKEERSTSYSFGMDYVEPEMNNFKLEASLFYTDLNDVFEIEEIADPSTPYTDFVRINKSGAKVYGFELNSGLDIVEGLNAKVGFIVQRSKFDEPEGDFGSIDFFRTPNVYGFGLLDYTHSQAGDFRMALQYTGSMKVPHYAGYILEDRLETSDPFWELNLHWSRRFPIGASKGLKFYVAAFNLLDQYQNDLDKGPDRDSGYIYGPNRQRSVFCGIRWEL